MMQLSNVYKGNSFYVVAYEDGHGTIELARETFTRLKNAKDWIKKQEENPDYVWSDGHGNLDTKFHIRKAELTREVRQVKQAEDTIG